MMTSERDAETEAEIAKVAALLAQDALCRPPAAQRAQTEHAADAEDLIQSLALLGDAPAEEAGTWSDAEHLTAMLGQVAGIVSRHSGQADDQTFDDLATDALDLCKNRLGQVSAKHVREAAVRLAATALVVAMSRLRSGDVVALVPTYLTDTDW